MFSYFQCSTAGQHTPADLFCPNAYAATVVEFDSYTIVEEVRDESGRVVGQFGVLPVGSLCSKQLLCEMRISERYPSLRLVKDCLRLCRWFDRMGYRLYAHSVPELSKFFTTIGFKEYGVMDDGYIRWVYNGKT